MRKIVGGMAISLDGFMEGPNGEWDWIIMDKEFDLASHMQRFDSFLVGRHTYEKLRNGTGFEQSVRSYVFSSSLTKVRHGFELVKTNTREFVDEMKRQPGKDIAVYGGAKLLTWLLREGLVDELVIPVMPVLLGSGRRFLEILNERKSLQLHDCRRYNSGVVIFYYSVN